MEATRLIVRHGEHLLDGAGTPSPVGTGVAQDEHGLLAADVPGFGYLGLDPDGRSSVVPAVTISADRLKAYLDLRRPAAGEPPITRSEVEAAIEGAGIGPGLSQDLLERAWLAFEENGFLERPHRIAEGVAPAPGQDAHLELEIDEKESVGEMGTQSRLD